jgi:hypothetical protein
VASTWPSFLPSLRSLRLRSHADVQASLILVHDNKEERIVRVEKAYQSPARLHVWWGNGAGMYELDLVSNKLPRAPQWHAKQKKKAWKIWLKALEVTK